MKSEWEFILGEAELSAERVRFLLNRLGEKFRRGMEVRKTY